MSYMQTAGSNDIWNINLTDFHTLISTTFYLMCGFLIKKATSCRHSADLWVTSSVLQVTPTFLSRALTKAFLFLPGLSLQQDLLLTAPSTLPKPHPPAHFFLFFLNFFHIHQVPRCSYSQQVMSPWGRLPSRNRDDTGRNHLLESTVPAHSRFS